jgi:GT2 family glycosyltransferase
VRPLEADPGLAVVTGQVAVPLPEHPTDYERDTAGLAQAEFVTANCLCRREVLAEVGGFDERFTAAWREDSDLQFTLLERGRRIAKAPLALVVHPVRPAPWGVSLRLQRKALFEALLYKRHPELYRQRIRPVRPWDYYVLVGALAWALAAAAWGRWPGVAGALLVWLVFTGRFVARRLRQYSRVPRHVAEMLVTSALIPPLSVFWRVYGGEKFRVPFF